MEKQKITGSEALLKALIAEGVDTIFGYPGGQAIPIYDSLYDYRDQLRHVLVRHEQGATHAAQGYARVSGKVGVTLVTSGPGATNTITGIADALMDSTPMVVIAGQVPSPLLGTDAFQEVDVIGITQPITKWAYQIRKPEEIAWAVSRAFYIASTGRPGPVVLDLAKDAQVGLVDYEYKKVDYVRSYQPEPDIKKDRIKAAADLINEAKKPFCLVGQGVLLGGAEEELKAFLQKNDIPAGSTVLGLSALPTDFPLNKGMLGMHGTKTSDLGVTQCDLLIVLGARFSDRVTGNAKTFAKQAKILQIDVDAAEINKNVVVDASVIGDVREVLRRLLEMIPEEQHPEWIEHIQEMKAKYPLTYDHSQLTGPYIIEKLYEITNGDAIISTDVGQHQMWAAQYFKYKEPRTFLTSGGLGTMGYGLGAAIGAKMGRPDKTVVNIAGDGCFRMNMNEIATAVRCGRPLIEIVLNNHVLGMVRQWQTLFYDHRYSHTILNDAVDFVKLAEAMGAKAIRITKMEEVEPALKEALACPGPIVLDCMIDQDLSVFPMVPAGASIDDIFDEEDMKNNEQSV